MFERCFVRNPYDRIESILDVNTARSAPGKPHAACSQKLEGGCLRIRGGTLDVHTVTTHYNLPLHSDECLSAWTTPCASTINCTRVAFYREGLLVGSVPCLRSLSAVVALPYRHNLAKRL